MKFLSKLLRNKLVLSTLITCFATGLVFFAPQNVLAQTAGDAIGSIDVPPGVDKVIADSGLGGDEIAALFFVSRIIRLVAVVAGLWTIVNVLLAGWTFVTSSGDAKANAKARDLITMSILGLILIGSVYTIAGVLSFVFFGNTSFILNPQISGPI